MTTRTGSLPSQSRTVSCGSSARSVPAPISTASAWARIRCTSTLALRPAELGRPPARQGDLAVQRDGRLVGDQRQAALDRLDERSVEARRPLRRRARQHVGRPRRLPAGGQSRGRRPAGWDPAARRPPASRRPPRWRRRRAACVLRGRTAPGCSTGWRRAPSPPPAASASASACSVPGPR